ncbi:response regulator [Paenibacillus sp. S-38]|uniref:response regulator n=1 Tax=Paenibacillus sp. S-38 TaxID=3416710 RepID=UPI003CF7DDBF
MKMRTKLLAGFGVLLLLLFALAGIGISRLTNTDSSLSEIYENRYNKVKLATNIRNNANELAKGVANILLISTPESDKKNLELIRTSSANVVKTMEDLENLEYNPRGKELVSSLLASGRRYLEYKDQALSLYQSGKVAEANNLRTSSGVNIQDQFIASMVVFSDYQEEQMDAAIADAMAQNRQTMASTGILTLAALLLSVVIMYWIITSMTRGLGTLSLMLQGFADGRWGDASHRVPITSNDEFGQLAAVFNQLADDLDATAAKERELHRINEENLWIQSRVGEMYYAMQDMTRLDKMGELFIGQLARTVEAQCGALYVLKDDGLHRRLELAGTYAGLGGEEAARSFAVGEGLIGQCAKDGQPVVLEGGEAQGRVRLAFGDMKPVTVMVQPVLYDEEVIGVFELVSLKTYSELERKFIDQAAEVGGVALNSLQGRLKIEELLRIHQALTEELQTQSEELLSQQDELRASNERLEDQAKALRASEELLQRQQEELEQSNEALQRKTAELEEQVRETEEVNRQVELARDSLEKQALELAVASRYKTEFLANMSHELRTPLNSLLILSQLLKENKEQNLSTKQVEYAETIHSSGSDLLRLIDDVLDLAKVESGRLDIRAETVLVQDVIDSLHRSFLPVARNRMLSFEIEVKEGTPVSLQSDSLRVQQILKNLLANAFKFTDSGCVKLTVQPAGSREPMLAFTVEDTGIGIPPEKQQLIFEAFQQADGTTSRKYGGTGLGLSISRQLASLLGGAIELESEDGRGSRFTLLLPMVLQPVKAGREGVLAGGMHEARDAVAAAMASAGGAALAGSPGMPGARSPLSAPVLRPPGSVPVSDSFADDREHIEPGDKVLLIIEDDAQFATILLDMARSRGFKAVVALQGDSGLQLAKSLRPDAILLDIQLPVLDGWAVMVQLKSDAATRHIPVHVISVNDEVLQGLSMGAIAWLRKPSTRDHLDQAFEQIQSFLERDIRSLLIVEPDEAQRIALIELIAHDDVSITAVESGAEALKALRSTPYDCMVIDYQLRDMAVYELLDEIKGHAELRRLPIMVYTGTELDKKEQLRLKKYAESIIIKDVRSPERLLDETSLFLHRVQEQLPEEKKTVLQKLHSIEAVFAGRKVLIVDDDIRNVFALSNLLEGLDMQVAFAETGKGALEQLEKEPDFDLVLMDIMMPVMDGYEAMRSIRDDERFDRLPIIALTAKAMKDDREKCIQAGASDYITKPVHTEQLLSLMRVWLSK